MPQNVTVLIAPLLAAWIGGSYIFGGPARTAGASFDTAKAMAPMPAWGAVFLLGAVALSVAIASRHRGLIAGAFFAGGAVYCWWAACFATQAATDAEASLVGWALYAALAFFHFVVASRFWKEHV